MNRDFEDYLKDILEAMGKAQQFVENFSYEKFRRIFPRVSGEFLALTS